MIEPRFCNYNLDYQQRLGFLKILAQVGAEVRGGPEEILQRLRDLYPESGKSTVGPFSGVSFDPSCLLKSFEVPSWQPGFSAKRLDRLVLWAEMLGIIAPTGRLSEWAIMLRGMRGQQGVRALIKANPFILTLGERALFAQILLYHDQVLPLLLKGISEIGAGVRLNLHKCCLLTIRSIGEFLDNISGHSANEIQLRVEVRDVLERIAAQYGVRDRRALQSKSRRSGILDDLANAASRKKRPHLAEYHTVCRFEQLTDLGLLIKEDPKSPPENESEREKVRTAWSWVTTKKSVAIGSILGGANALDKLIEERWIEFSSRATGQPVTRLHPFQDQIELAGYLDATLPMARRRIGPVRLHTWATMALAQAFENGLRAELSDVISFINALHRDKVHGQQVRLGGREVFSGRTVVVPSSGIGQLLKRRPIKPGGGE
jgi:hypothetical protein